MGANIRLRSTLLRHECCSSAKTKYPLLTVIVLTLGPLGLQIPLVWATTNRTTTFPWPSKTFINVPKVFAAAVYNSRHVEVDGFLVAP